MHKFILSLLSLLLLTSPVSAYTNNYKYPRDNSLVIKSSTLGQCFFQVINKNFDVNKIRLELHRDQYPELFSYLMGSRSFDYHTGKESALRDWVSSQQDNSIDPVNIFEKSLLLNNGDIFEAILTIHQLLRNEARFYKDYIRYHSSHKNKERFYNKFIDIRGDLEERAGGSGDHSGSWYRIWGTMLSYLNGIEISNKPPQPYKGPLHHLTFNNYNGPQIYSANNDHSGICEQNFSHLHQSLAKGFGISSLAEWLKYPLTLISEENWVEKDNRKASINRSGYLVAHSMIKGLQYPDKSTPNLECSPNDYLIEAENKGKKLINTIMRIAPDPI